MQLQKDRGCRGREDRVASRENMVAGSGGRLVTLHLHSGSRYMWLGYQASKPRPRDSLFQLDSKILKVPQPLQAVSPDVDQVFKHVSLWGTFPIQTTAPREVWRWLLHKLSIIVNISAYCDFASSFTLCPSVSILGRCSGLLS